MRVSRMQRMTFDDARSRQLNTAWEKIDKMNGIYTGQGYPKPHIHVGTYQTGIIDIRVREELEFKIRNYFRNNKINFKEHRAHTGKAVNHFTLEPDQFNKLLTSIDEQYVKF